MNNKTSNIAIVNVLTTEISLELDYNHNRIEPLILGRSYLYIEINLLTCYVPSWLIFTLNEFVLSLMLYLINFLKQPSKCSSNWYSILHCSTIDN